MKTLVSRKCVQNFNKKLLNSMVVEARQSFQFLRQNTWFLENNRALSKFLYGILYYLIIITKLLKKSVHKSQFYINDASHPNPFQTKLSFHSA